MDIGYAVQAMREGARVRRSGWNGRGMWLAICEPDGEGKVPEKLSEREMTQPYVYMKTAQGDFIPWLCSQADLLADDWEIVDD